MDRKNWMMLFGVGLMLLFFGLYYIFKSPIYLFNITIGALALVYGFYTEGKEIKVSLSYCVASSSVNIIQWLLVIYIFSSVHRNGQFNMALIFAIMTTVFLVNRLHREYLKIHENSAETVDVLKDPKRLILLCTSLIVTIGCLGGFIFYHAFTLLSVATFGLTAFVYGYYHENGKLNISVRYVEAMGFTIVLQWIILINFCFQFAAEDWSLASTFSMMITVFFLVQFYQSEITLSDLILD